MARVALFLPHPNEACLECAWNQSHYDALKVIHACQVRGSSAAPPTNAPAYLGALAAALQADELRAILSPAHGRRSGRQLLLNLKASQLMVSQGRRNPGCRFDHRVFAPKPAPAGMQLAEALSLAGADAADASLEVYRRQFLHSTACPQCGLGWAVNRFISVAESQAMVCPSCGKPAPAPNLSQKQRMAIGAASPELRQIPLSSLGIRAGDLFTVAGVNGEEYHWILGGIPSAEQTS
jgi:hypothetical protein